MTSNVEFLHNALAANGFDASAGRPASPLHMLSALDYLADKCAELARQKTELRKALKQARADRDENEQVIIRLQEANADLRRELASSRVSFYLYQDKVMQAEHRRNLAASQD